MSVYEYEWLQHEMPRPAGERRFQLFAFAAVVLFTAYLAATVAGTPRDILSLVYSVAVLPVPLVGWWAYRRAREDLRVTFLLCAWAATLLLVGSLIWYGFFLAEGSQVPPSPGVWDICFVTARLLLIAAVLSAIRSLVCVRLAALDACVIVAAGVAIGAAFIGRGLEERVTPATLVTLNRPLLGIITLILIASAALGSWEGMPRSIALLGLGEVAFTIGSLIYSYSAVQGEFVDDRWADLAWAAGAGVSMLAGSVLILGIDRPVVIRSRVGSNDAPRLGAALYLTLVAIGVTFGVATYGFITARETVAVIGVAASAAIAVAMAFRAQDALRTGAHSSELLDDALLQSERARDALNLANERLQRKNAELRTLQIAVAQGFNLIDERTQGRLRELIEQAGDDLVALFDETVVDED
jgi:hypothetical protein